MVQGSRFIVASNSHVWSDTGVTADLLRSRRLFKTLSLLVAKAAGVNVPPSLLLLGRRRELIADFARKWGCPLMIRLDYRRSPRQKPLGGVPLYTLDAMCGVCEYLFKRECLPLFHPNLDRFRDIYSVGVSLRSDGYEAEIEVVGRGFDAGDLRLGKAVPHERIAADLSDGSLSRRGTISDTDYRRERASRIERVRRLKAYIDFANRSAMLATDLNAFNPTHSFADSNAGIPHKYQRIPNTILRKLIEIVQTIRLSVIHGLPASKDFVASLSYLPGKDWILWDIYGDWYRR